MDYKKMEARLEIEVVKDMVNNGNYAHARAKLHEVKNFFPNLDDISEMINVCDTLHSTTYNFLGCGSDWYWVLRINPDADQVSIQYQFNKITSLLEPIVSKFPGTKTALEAVQSAFLVLSDVEKRSEFNMKRAGSLQDYVSTDVVNFTSKSCVGDCYDFENIRKAEVFIVGQVWAAYDDEDHMPRNYARIISIDASPFKISFNWLKPAPYKECERKWCEAGLPVVCGYFEIDEKTPPAIATSPSIFSHMVSQHASVNEKIEIYPKKHEIWAIYKEWKPSEWTVDPGAWKGSKLQIVEIIKGYSNQDDMLVVGLVNAKGFKTIFKRYTKNDTVEPFPIPAQYLYMFSHSLPAYRFTGREIDEIISERMFDLDPLAVPKDIHCMPESSDTSKDESCDTSKHFESVKCKWSLKDFDMNQVWAVYDDRFDDSMPRQYVVVADNSVLEDGVGVIILEPHPVLDEEVQLTEENLPIVCGSFKLGKTIISVKLSQFSHLINCDRILNGSVYKINPRKGEIWAMYKNWNKKWKNSNLGCYRCRIVEIVTDFCDETGLIVAGLEEVPGCTTFFQRQMCDGFELIRAVSRVEMLGFSHRIPGFNIPGIGNYGIPDGAWHLESDALPPNHGNQVT